MSIWKNPQFGKPLKKEISVIYLPPKKPSGKITWKVVGINTRPRLVVGK